MSPPHHFAHWHAPSTSAYASTSDRVSHHWPLLRLWRVDAVSCCHVRRRGTLAQRLVLIAVPLALLAVATVLLLGLWNIVWGQSAVTSQRLMRWRVALQFIALCLGMAALYLSVR